jgi:peptidyl-prolyl cis-trans isomerase SurA
MTEPKFRSTARRPPARLLAAGLLVTATAALVTAASSASAQFSRPKPASLAAPESAGSRGGDYIAVVVNQELVTAGEIEQRLARVRENAARAKSTLPPATELRQQVLEALIDERVQVTHARDSGTRIDEAELDRAVLNVAVQNQISLPQLRERLRADGMDFTRFRNNIRDQMMVERIREREVQGRIRITDADIDATIEKERANAGSAAEFNIAQVLIGVPEGASVTAVAERLRVANTVYSRVKAGETFEDVARAISEDGNKAQGGVIGMRGADRLPEIFVAQVRNLKAGELAAEPLRTGAGFHVLKLVERRDAGAFSITQTMARHILLKPSAQLSQDAAIGRLADFKRQITSGAKTFAQMAKDNSEDGSAPQGGELGWVSPGGFVPEFEEAMNALALGALSDPVVSRFGVHLIQVTERKQTTLEPKQQREQARNVLREQKFEEAYVEWLRDLRARAYVERREAPQ